MNLYSMAKKIKEVPEIVEPVSDDKHEEMKDLLIKSIKWSEAVYHQNKKIQSHLRLMSIMGIVRLCIILIPLIIGLIYLPPLLSGAWTQYQSLLGVSPGALDNESMKMLLEQFGSGSNSVDIQNILSKFSGN